MAERTLVRVTADIAVVGAGPAGIAAAVRASESGAQVVLLDEAPRPGGQIWRQGTRRRLPVAARSWLRRLEASGAQVLGGVTVVDAKGTRLLAERAGEALAIAAGQVILATGARELFLPFPGWTLPGVVGAAGAQALLKAGMGVEGRRAVVAGSGPLLMPVAAGLAGAGARLAVVAEQAPASAVLRFGLGLWRSPGKIAQAARYRAAFPLVSYRQGTWVVRADGDERVREATLTDGRRRWTEPCDLLAVGYGLTPATELPRLLSCALENGRVRVDELQRTSVPDVFCAGEPTSMGGVDAALVEGEIAGLAATERAWAAKALQPRRTRAHAFARRLETAFALREELRGLADEDTIVCRCEDVRAGSIEPAWGARPAKLYTRAGMGPCQGRVCGAALRHLHGWAPDSVRAPVAAAAVNTLLYADTLDPEG